MRELGWSVTLISAPGERLADVAKREGVRVEEVPMRRQPSPVRDLIALFRMSRTLKRLNPDVINYGTPKAALLGSMAAWWTKIPVRIYLLRGLRCEGTSGVARPIYVALERITSWCSTTVLCVSQSLRRKAVELRTVNDSKAVVLGNGSSNGVDCVRFRLTPEVVARASELRRKLRLKATDNVIGFVGRMVRDKGVPELVAAFDEISDEFPQCHLLLAGPSELGNAISTNTATKIHSHSRIHMLGKTQDTPAVYAACDIITLPTHREGFPNVALEAAAMERPLISTTATGAVDAVQNGVTGLTVEVGSASGIADALRTYLNDPELRVRHGSAGRNRVVAEFESQAVWKRLDSLYRELLRSHQ